MVGALIRLFGGVFVGKLIEGIIIAGRWSKRPACVIQRESFRSTKCRIDGIMAKLNEQQLRSRNLYVSGEDDGIVECWGVAGSSLQRMDICQA